MKIKEKIESKEVLNIKGKTIEKFTCDSDLTATLMLFTDGTYYLSGYSVDEIMHSDRSDDLVEWGVISEEDIGRYWDETQKEKDIDAKKYRRAEYKRLKKEFENEIK